MQFAGSTGIPAQLDVNTIFVFLDARAHWCGIERQGCLLPLKVVYLRRTSAARSVIAPRRRSLVVLGCGTPEFPSAWPFLELSPQRFFPCFSSLSRARPRNCRICFPR